MHFYDSMVEKKSRVLDTAVNSVSEKYRDFLQADNYDYHHRQMVALGTPPPLLPNGLKFIQLNVCLWDGFYFQMSYFSTP